MMSNNKVLVCNCIFRFGYMQKSINRILFILILIINSNAQAQTTVSKNDFFQSIRTKMNTVNATTGISSEYFVLADTEYFIRIVDRWLVGVVIDQNYLRTFASFFKTEPIAGQGLTQEKSTWNAMVTPKEAKYNGFIILSVFSRTGDQGTEFHEAIHAFSLSRSLGDIDADVYGGPEFLSNGFLSILGNLRRKDNEINTIIAGLKSGNNMTTEITAFWNFINHLEKLYKDATKPNQVTQLLQAIRGKADWAGYRQRVEQDFIKARESHIPDNWFVNCKPDFSVVSEEGLSSEKMAGPFKSNVAANGWIILNCPSRVCDKDKKCPVKTPEKEETKDKPEKDSEKKPDKKPNKKPEKKPNKNPVKEPEKKPKCKDLDKGSKEWLENCQDKDESIPEALPDLTLEFTCGDSFELSPNDVLYPKTCYVNIKNAVSTHDRVELEVNYNKDLLDVTFDSQSEVAKSPANNFLLIIRTRVPVPAVLTSMTILVKHGSLKIEKTVDVSILSPGIEPSSGSGIRPPAVVDIGSGGKFCVWRDKSFGDPPECFNITTAECTNNRYADKPRYELVGSNMTWGEADKRSFALSRYKGNAYNCDPFNRDKGISDKDHDSIADDKDNCPTHANKNQNDTDGDGIGDVCDNDFDNDNIPNFKDNCPATKNQDQKDIDADGKGDACDNNSDNDDILDFDDNCKMISNPSQDDLDNDGIGDACDNDIDGDGKNNNSDNCYLIKNPSQLDKDADGIGDLCDNDKDGDGKLNGEDNCEDVYNPDQKNSDDHWMGDACASPINKDDLSGVDCSAYPGTHAVWDDNTNSAGCICSGTKDWSDNLKRCATQKEIAMAAANCSSYGNAKAVWDEASARAMCECNKGYEFDDNNQCVAVSDDECSDYPGTILVNNQCQCPGALEWSDTKNQCVNNADLAGADVDCTPYPGSFPQFDHASNSWKCECMGNKTWSATMNRCASSEDEAVAGTDCSSYKGTTAIYDDFVGKVVCKCINSGLVLSDTKGSCMSAADAAVADHDCSSFGAGATSYLNPLTNKADCQCTGNTKLNSAGTACETIVAATPTPPTGQGQLPTPTIIKPGVCDVLYDKGANKPESYVFQVAGHASISLYYDTYDVKDNISVLTSSRSMLWSSGCVGQENTQVISIPAGSQEIIIDVHPNCSGTSGTGWKFKASCQ